MNKTFSVSSTELNTHNPYYYDTVISGQIDFPQINGEIKYHVPRRIQFINKSGQDVTVNIFSSTDEYTKYTADATNFDFFTVPAGTVYNMGTSENLPNAVKVAVKMPTASASGVFQFECIGYQQLF
jgi:hypothetical protein